VRICEEEGKEGRIKEGRREGREEREKDDRG
jgi:hypothetical protein